MKKTLFFPLACLLLFSSLTTAQTPGDHQFQFQFENTLSEWVQAPDGNWFGAGWSVSYPGYPMGVPFVIKWNPQSNNILWKKQVPMPLSEYVWDVALLPTADGGVYIGAVFDGCDYGTWDELAKLDANGNVLWNIQTPENYTWSSKLWLIPYPDGHLLYQTDRYQVEYDADGVVIWKDQVQFKWNGIAPRQDGGYLVYGDQKIGTTNLFLSIIEYPFAEEIIYAHQLPSGNWLVLSAQNIYRLASDFSVLDQNAIPDIKPWSKIYETDSDYWVSSENAGGEFVLNLLDTATLAEISAHNSGSNYRVNSLIHIPGSSLVWLSGDGNFDRNQTVFLKSAPKNNPVIAPSRSVALTNIRSETTPKVYYNYCSNWDENQNYEIRFEQVFVTVKNTGNVPVQKCRVNGSFNRCSFICQGFQQISEEMNISLAPGDSVEFLLLDNLTIDGQYNFSYFELCFWAALPDDRLDANPEDDEFCKTFSVIVPTQEPTLSQASVRVFPNPSKDRVTFSIESPDPIEDPCTLSLTNLSGQVILREDFSGPVYTLTRATLPTGVYFYEISSHRSAIGKGKLVFME